MSLPRSMPLLIILLLWLVMPVEGKANSALLSQGENNRESDPCQSSVLSNLRRHQIAPGETIETIALDNNLIPETLIRLNPSLKEGSPPVGSEILIPPFNGIAIEVPEGASWQDLEAAYGVRADVLFEINGCQKTPKVVFLPGVNWVREEDSSVDTYVGLGGYPLPTRAEVGLAYGWYKDPESSKNSFHSGIDLLAEPGTPVLAADDGIALFAGQEGNYGYLVVVDHGGGRQTRYAHLGRMNVRSGQEVKSGDTLGVVGSSGFPDLDIPHLHFEVRYNSPLGWVAQDPEIHLAPSNTVEQ